MKTMELLFYHGKAMNPEPYSMALTAVVGRLKDGQPVMVQLEPGDATHYGLLIVPAWADAVAPYLGRYGIRPHTAHSYLIVSQLNDTGGDSFFAFDDGTEAWGMKSIKNEWTREVFAWWFKILWQQIREA